MVEIMERIVDVLMPVMIGVLSGIVGLFLIGGLL